MLPSPLSIRWPPGLYSIKCPFPRFPSAGRLAFIPYIPLSPLSIRWPPGLYSLKCPFPRFPSAGRLAFIPYIPLSPLSIRWPPGLYSLKCPFPRFLSAGRLAFVLIYKCPFSAFCPLCCPQLIFPINAPPQRLSPYATLPIDWCPSRALHLLCPPP